MGSKGFKGDEVAQLQAFSLLANSLNYQNYILTAAERKRNTEEQSERTGMQNLQTNSVRAFGR